MVLVGFGAIGHWVQYLSPALAVIAVLVGLRSATVEVRDNLDEFIGDLRRQGRWATWAAIAAAISVFVDQTFKLMG